MEFDWIRLPIRRDPDKAALLHINLCDRLREERDSDYGQGKLMVNGRVWNRSAGFDPDLAQIRSAAQTPDC